MTPSATGSLADTPLAHALVYARNRRLSGRLELTATEDRQATITLFGGRISAVETNPVGLCPGGYFGAVAYELGFIDAATLDETLLEIAKTHQLHGEVLIARKAITAAQRDEALVEQIHRRVHHLFALPETTTYAFWDARAPFEPPTAVDLVGPVWRGIRDYPPMKFVSETIRRIGEQPLRTVPSTAEPRLPPAESKLLETLAGRPMTILEMKLASDLPPGRVELLAYLLVIAKHVESVAGTRTHPSTGALPAAMPSGQMPAVTGHTAAARRSPSTISSTSIPSYRASVPVPVVSPSPSPSPPPAGSLAALRTPAELGLDGVTARAHTIEDEDYFGALGVAEGASAEAVRAAYIRLTKAWHPDRLVPDFLPVRTDVAKIFSHMTRAQKTLCDPDTRRAYMVAKSAKTTAVPRADVMRQVEQAMSKRSFELAVQLCQQLITADSDDAEALAIHAWASVRDGEASEDEIRAALVRLDKAVNVDRSSAPAVYHRGLAYKRLNNVMAAFRDFARAVQLDPTHLGAEREVRLFAMRAKKGSGEQTLALGLVDKRDKK